MIRWHWADPGETVGWASGRVLGPEDRPGQGKDLSMELLVDDYGQDKSKTYIRKLLYTASTLDVIGYESYIISQNHAQDHVGSSVPTLQVIGQIRLAAWMGQWDNHSGFPTVVEQRNTQKRTGMSAAKLWAPDMVPVIADALSGPHDDGHYGDALLHAIAWFHLNHAGR